MSELGLEPIVRTRVLIPVRIASTPFKPTACRCNRAAASAGVRRVQSVRDRIPGLPL